MATIIKKLRQELNVSQEALARELGIPQPLLSDIENRKRVAYPVLRRRFSFYLSGSEEEFFDKQGMAKEE